MAITTSPSELTGWIGLSWEQLVAEASTAGSRYHVYPIMMGTKKRWIEAPDGSLKLLQRRLLDRVLYRLEPTRWAHGFVRGRSIVSNAAEHCGRQWVVSLDIKDFFPSVTRAMVVQSLRELLEKLEERQLVGDLVTRRDRLPQGAPTSPHLANLTVRDLDRRLGEMATEFGWTYTRYADDMSFSGDREPRMILSRARRIIEGEGFELSSRKTTVRGQHQRQSVTGLIVNEKVSLPREKRRLLRTMLHRLEKGGEHDPATLESLGTINGHLAFEAMVLGSEFSQHHEQLDELLQDTPG